MIGSTSCFSAFKAAFLMRSSLLPSELNWRLTMTSLTHSKLCFRPSTNLTGASLSSCNFLCTSSKNELLPNTGCSLGTDICNVPFNFYLILILASFLLFLSSIYREVLLLSGKTCNKFNHNCAKARAFH